VAEDDIHQRNLDYAESLVELIAEDAKQVYVRVTGAVGLAVLFLTQLPFDRVVALALWARWALAVGIACAVGSAACLYYYSTRLYRARVDMLKAIKADRPQDVPKIWAYSGRVWDQTQPWYKAGIGLLTAAVVLLGLVLAALLNLVP
jgi:hypothetical protein